MALGLDLSQSDAKIARARVHLATLRNEVLIFLQHRNPYTPRVEKEIDKQGEWYVVYVKSGDPVEHSLGVIVGDIIHNLRCALDYIVSTLVEASKGTVGDKHFFPIHVDQKAYANNVGTATSVVKGRRLDEVIYGLQEIWDLQPFQRKPRPGFPTLPGVDIAESDPLFHIQRFSNADKHRICTKVLPLIDAGSQLTFSYEAIPSRVEMPPLPDWEPNIDYKMARVQLTPGQVRLDPKISVRVCFGTPAFGKYPVGQAVDLGMFDLLCEYVTEIVNTFKAL